MWCYLANVGVVQYLPRNAARLTIPVRWTAGRTEHLVVDTLRSCDIGIRFTLVWVDLIPLSSKTNNTVFDQRAMSIIYGVSLGVLASHAAKQFERNSNRQVKRWGGGGRGVGGVGVDQQEGPLSQTRRQISSFFLRERTRINFEERRVEYVQNR